MDALRRRERQDPFLEGVRSHLLHEEVSTDREERLDTKRYLLDHRDLVWYTSGGSGNPVLVIHRELVSGLMALVHAMYGHPSVASALALLREHFHWATMTRNVQEYAL